MIEKIKRIRELLSEIESQQKSQETDSFERNFNALELPDIVIQIVDYLQPQLHPYEATIYWYLFRHSIVGQGTQEARVSVRGLCSGVIKSSSGQSNNLSYGAVQEALRGLEEKQCIKKDGDTNRTGTPYHVYIPEEISWCVDLMRTDQNKEQISHSVDEVREVDYYNILENRLKIFERDAYKCKYCGKQLTRFSATLDHIQPVSHGGLNSFDNLVTSCLHCNSSRGNQPVMDALTKGKAEQASALDAKKPRG
jgi:hypothetical protein